MIVGIDLGTTNSLIGIWHDGQSVLIPNAHGAYLTPSAVGVDNNGEILVGAAAAELLSVAPSRMIASFKRYMGTKREFTLGQKKFRPEELSALILKSLKSDAEAFIGEEVCEAVISVPAYFNDIQRKATKLAGEMAGLKVDRLINEPTAAALAFGISELDKDKKILVLDLGGGTFDVSLLEMFDSIMEVRASTGDNYLGGEDFVDVIIDFIIAEVGDIPPRSAPAKIHAVLRRQSEIAKRALSDQTEAQIEFIHNGKSVQKLLTRSHFEKLSEPLLKRIARPIERALRDSKIAPSEIGQLVLVGGATRMPMFKRLAARLLDRFPIVPINPEEAIARGAAIQAGLKMQHAALNDVVMTDVAPFTLGVDIAQPFEGKIATTGVFLPLIERNTVIPASRSEILQTTHDNQQRIEVGIFQGEARMVEQNIELGRLSVPVPAAPAGNEQVDVRFTYDVSGLLEVEATVKSTGERQRLVIEGNLGGLQPHEIEGRIKSLQNLKIHPRDQAENRAVLARAERLYEERLGSERTAIGSAIDRFRLILLRQDPREIEEHRNAFAQWLDSIDRPFLA